MKKFNLQIFRKKLKELFGNETQAAIAKKLNLTQSRISEFLTGKNFKMPTLEQLITIADKYEVSVDWLLGFSEVKTDNTEIRELCDELGLDERVIKYLKREEFCQCSKNIIEDAYSASRKKGVNYSLVNDAINKSIELSDEDVVRVRYTINKLVLSHMDDHNYTNSLLFLLERFFKVSNDFKELSTHADVGNYSIVTKKNEEGEPQFFDAVNIKELMFTSNIQDINNYLITEKNRVLAEEQSNDKT